MIILNATPGTLSEVDNLIRQIILALEPTDRELEPIREAIRHGFARNFAAQADAELDPWLPLADRTVLERIQLGFPGREPILVRTGSYRASFVDPGAAGHVSETFVNRAMIRVIEGTEDERADELEAGLNLNIPARPVTNLSQAAQFVIDEEIASLFDFLLPE